MLFGNLCYVTLSAVSSSHSIKEISTGTSCFPLLSVYVQSHGALRFLCTCSVCGKTVTDVGDMPQFFILDISGHEICIVFCMMNSRLIGQNALA